MQTSYEIKARAPLASCSSFPSNYTFRKGEIHDSPSTEPPNEERWEDFDISSVPAYIARAMPLIYANLQRLEDTSEPYLLSQGSELLFMIEAVVQARSLLD